jgi:hypothetical protein
MLAIHHVWMTAAKAGIAAVAAKVALGPMASFAAPAQGGCYRSEADMVEIHEYAPIAPVFVIGRQPCNHLSVGLLDAEFFQMCLHVLHTIGCDHKGWKERFKSEHIPPPCCAG